MSKSQYIFVWSNYQSLLNLEMNFLAFKDFRDFDWNKTSNVIEFSRDNVIRTFHSKKDSEEDKKRSRNFLDRMYSENFFNQEEKSYRESWEFFNKLKIIKYEKITNKDLVNLLSEAISLWCIQIGYFRASQADGTYYLLEEVRKVFSKEEIFSLLTPPNLDIINEEIIDWEKIIKSPYSKRKMIGHMEKYPWVVAAHFTIEDCLETLKHRYKFGNLLSEENILKEKKELKIKQEELLKKADENQKNIILTLQRMAISRSNVKSCWAGTDFYLIPLFEEICRRSGENVYDINKFYLKDEIINLVIKGIKISNNEKQKRKELFVGLWKNEKLIFKSGLDAEKLVKKELQDLYEVKNEKEIKGFSANKGVAKGVVRILGANNIEKSRELRRTFKKGEILVTEMTQPNIVDIASRAGAIITDEGGMLSHAAIISREFKIPCIVGTKIATQVLKDGDLVEVDADRGVVRIIKRAENLK